MQFYDYTIYIDNGTFNFGICESKDVNSLFHNNPDFYSIKRIITQSDNKEAILNAHKTFGRLNDKAQKYFYDIEKRIAFIPYSKDIENASSKFMKYSERMLSTKFSMIGIAGVTMRSFSKFIVIGLTRLFDVSNVNIIFDDRFRCKCHAINDEDYNSWKDEMFNFMRNSPTKMAELSMFFYEFEKVITNLQDIEIEDASIMSPSKYFNIE